MKFYATFAGNGSNSYPFRADEYVLIYAESLSQAYSTFCAVYGRNKRTNTHKCEGIWTERQFETLCETRNYKPESYKVVLSPSIELLKTKEA